MFEPLGEYIRLCRLGRNLTQERLAKLAGVSRRQLSLLEDGRNVSVLFLIKICKVLEIDELPLGQIRLKGTGPEFQTLVQAAEALATVKPLLPLLEQMADDIRRTSAVFDELLARALTPGLSTDELLQSAEILASLPVEERTAAGETLRAMSERNPKARAPRPAASGAGARKRGR
jgi:transcriptional regulator with XRE-family HTH domain